MTRARASVCIAALLVAACTTPPKTAPNVTAAGTPAPAPSSTATTPAAVTTLPTPTPFPIRPLGAGDKAVVTWNGKDVAVKGLPIVSNPYPGQGWAGMWIEVPLAGPDPYMLLLKIASAKAEAPKFAPGFDKAAIDPGGVIIIVNHVPPKPTIEVAPGMALADSGQYSANAYSPREAYEALSFSATRGRLAGKLAEVEVEHNGDMAKPDAPKQKGKVSFEFDLPFSE